jgi:hypothetical protein
LFTLPFWLLTAACSAPQEAALWLGGDIHFGPSGAETLAPLREVLGNDWGIVNLEGPISPGDTVEKNGERLILRNPERTGEELRMAGIWAAGVQNNHSLDLDTEGLQNTIMQLQTAGVLPVGNEYVALQEQAGMLIAVTAHDLSKGVPKYMKGQLESAAEKSDALVVTFHVAEESNLPSPALEEAVEIALAAGSRVVAVHGSHKLGAVERRGDSVVAWGLGNLVFHCQCTKEKEAMLLRVWLNPNGSTRAEVLPIEAGLYGQPALPAEDPDGLMDFIDALGGTKLTRKGKRGHF